MQINLSWLRTKSISLTEESFNAKVVQIPITLHNGETYESRFSGRWFQCSVHWRTASRDHQRRVQMLHMHGEAKGCSPVSELFQIVLLSVYFALVKRAPPLSTMSLLPRYATRLRPGQLPLVRRSGLAH